VRLAGHSVPPELNIGVQNSEPIYGEGNVTTPARPGHDGGVSPGPHDSLTYTLRQLARLDLRIRAEVLRTRLQQTERARDEFQGLYIPDAHVDALLDRSIDASALLESDAPASDELHKVLCASAALEQRLRETEFDGSGGATDSPRLERLRALFALSDFEIDVILVALSAEIDLKYEHLFAYLQDDVTKKRPTVDLTLRLLCPTLQTRLAARKAFEVDSPLMRWDLITVHDDPNARRPVLLARYLKLDERIAGYLLGSDAVDGRLRAIAANGQARSRFLPTVAAEWLERVSRDHFHSESEGKEATDRRAPVFLLHGKYGSGRRAVAGALARALGRPLLLLGAGGLLESDISIGQHLRLAERESMLTGALLGWTDADLLLAPERAVESVARRFLEGLANSRVPTVLIAEKPWEPGRRLERRRFVRLELPDISHAERRALWVTGLTEPTRPVPILGDDELTALASRFRLTAGQIEDALAQAQTLARARGVDNGQPSLEDVDAACRMQAQHNLGVLARRLTPRYTWDDIVLPPQQLATLRLIGTMIRERSTVYDEWGFDRKLAMGKGVIAMFTGPSGTGKTMAAEILARDLGLDLYRIDLSAVVNKYIGETEKNLERLFSEAQETDAMLFFDEADALFGKRSGVSDAHDRYANIETAYLLQRTEEYNGLVILASNLPKNVDDAFARRLHFTINFPAPEEPERLEIWRRTFPPEVPRASDLDLAFLARKLKITGGNIRNIVLAAAFLAAEQRTSIAMRHLLQAARYELQKIGKMVLDDDFERYSGVEQRS
jgi:AAA+ superfamily predicted ATPase